MPYTQETHHIPHHGRVAEGTLFRPDTDKKVPLVLFCHGYNGRRDSFFPAASFLAESGIACFCLDFCGGAAVDKSGFPTEQMTLLTEKEDLGAALERGAGKSSEFTLRRGGQTIKADVTPVKDKKGTQYKIGVLIRDELSGIGTVTYIEKGSGRFGSLGHAVCDEERDSLSIADASVYLCSIIGVNRGERGRAGALKGLFLSDYKIASADKVCETGLYGTFDDGYDCSALPTVEIAPLSAATIGSAVIYSTVDGTVPQAYDVAIAKVDPNNKQNKNFVIKVTDEAAVKEEGEEQAKFYHSEVFPAMEALRAPVDKLEMIVDKEAWPMPSYGDLIFEV